MIRVATCRIGCVIIAVNCLSPQFSWTSYLALLSAQQDHTVVCHCSNSSAVLVTHVCPSIAPSRSKLGDLHEWLALHQLICLAMLASDFSVQICLHHNQVTNVVIKNGIKIFSNCICGCQCCKDFCTAVWHWLHFLSKCLIPLLDASPTVIITCFNITDIWCIISTVVWITPGYSSCTTRLTITGW